MSDRLRRGLAGVGAVVGALAVLLPFTVDRAGAAPAVVAQESPLPLQDLLPLLQPLQPMLEVISPIVYPACSDAVLVSVLGGALGIPVPPELSNVTGPLLVLCGTVPIPATNTRTCALDQQAQAAIAELTKPILGGGLPIEVAPVKWVSGLLDNIVDAVDQTQVPQGSQIAAVFQCTDPVETSSTLATPPTTASSATTPDVPVTEPAVDLPSFADLQTLPPVPTAVVPAPAVTPVVASPVQLTDQPRFRYPVVMGLPLAFLALLVFFGRALTRPLGGDR
jgi:hypothetical protein